MKITGTVRIDLSEHVSSGFLFVDANVHLVIWKSLCGVDGILSCDLWIGDAYAVSWHDRRVVEALATVRDVVITGTDARGVRQALDRLQLLFESHAA